jgi:1,4-alpha-glucan branching enzyme
MVDLIVERNKFQEISLYKYWEHSGDQVLAFGRDDLLFVYNFHPYNSYTDYGMLVAPGEYEMVLNTDSKSFGGFGLSDESIHHFTMPADGFIDKEWIKLYVPSRSAFVLRRINNK